MQCKQFKIGAKIHYITALMTGIRRPEQIFTRREKRGSGREKWEDIPKTSLIFLNLNEIMNVHNVYIFLCILTLYA